MIETFQEHVTRSTSGTTDKRKRKVTEALREENANEDLRSKFDDSSDEDYIQPQYADDDLDEARDYCARVDMT